MNSMQGQWGYKIELESMRFFDYFSVSGRLTKLNTSLPKVRVESLWMLRVAFKYRLGDFTLGASSGVANERIDNSASTVIPTLGGESSTEPLFSIGVKYHAAASAQAYSLKWANYDVFDAYPADQPFFQMDVDHDVGGFSIFAYGRYRYNGSVDNLYAFYTAVGVVIPFEEKEKPTGNI